MGLAKRALMLAGMTAVALVIINLITKNFLPGLRPYLGLA